MLALFVVLGLAGYVAFLFLKVTSIQSQTASFQQLTHSLQNDTELLRNDVLPSCYAASCAALPPSSPSGYYWIMIRATDMALL